MLGPMKPVHARMAGGLVLLLSIGTAWVTSHSQPLSSASTAAPSMPYGVPNGIPNGGISPVSPNRAPAPAAAPASPAAAVVGGAPDGVAPTPVPGIVEVRRGADIVYMSSDGKYVFTGELYEVPTHKNLTEARQRDLRRSLINSVPESQMLVFSPPNPKYTVTVFTDVDCPYCRQFHKQIADYNRLGIEVDYVLFPLSIHPGADKKAEAVWCAADRNTAYTAAMNGENLPQKTCSNPIKELTASAMAMGLSGTPAIIANDGMQLGGYVSPAELAQRLDSGATRKPTN